MKSIKRTNSVYGIKPLVTVNKCLESAIIYPHSIKYEALNKVVASLAEKMKYY